MEDNAELERVYTLLALVLDSLEGSITFTPGDNNIAGKQVAIVSNEDGSWTVGLEDTPEDEQGN